jgi:transaldolase
MAESRLRALAEHGQSVWIDMLSHEFIRSGELQRLRDEDAVTGVTSNPTIFQKAIAGGDYDGDIAAALERTTDPLEIFHEIAIGDVRDACDVFAPVFEATGGRDGFVSLEVDPSLAHDAPATLAQAVELHARVERPNLYVKIPGTREGVTAFEDATAQGIPVNVTLIFSLQRYRDVVAAYLRGLSRLRMERPDALTHVSSVASFFVSRVDTEADRRLAEVGRDDLRGRLAIANARLAYAHFRATFAGAVWERLSAAGATVQRPLWASTSAKDPAYRDVVYVEELVGPDTVNTMPPETLEAFRDHGVVRGDTVAEGVEQAEALLDDLAAAGVDYDDVVETLEREGVDKFTDSFDELIAGIESKRGELASR